MKRFDFRLAPLLQLRRNERDLCQSRLAECQQRRAELNDANTGVMARRLVQFEELRALAAGERLHVEALLARHDHTVRLDAELARIEAELRAAASRIDACRRALLEANQRVEALEKLESRQASEFVAAEERREALGLDDAWQSLRSAVA